MYFFIVLCAICLLAPILISFCNSRGDNSSTASLADERRRRRQLLLDKSESEGLRGPTPADSMATVPLPVVHGAQRR